MGGVLLIQPIIDYTHLIVSMNKSSYSSSSSSSQSKSHPQSIASCVKRANSRPSRFVGRPSPFLRSINPEILITSKRSYSDWGVIFSKYSGTSLAPNQFSVNAFTLNE